MRGRMDNSIDTLIIYSDENEKIIADAIKQVFSLFEIGSELINYDGIANPPSQVKRYNPEPGREWLLNINKADKEVKDLFSYKRYAFVVLTEQSVAFALRVVTLRGAIKQLEDKQVVFVDPEKKLTHSGSADIAEILNEKNKLTDSIYSLCDSKILSVEKIKKHFGAFMEEVSHENRRK